MLYLYIRKFGFVAKTQFFVHLAFKNSELLINRTNVKIFKSLINLKFFFVNSEFTERGCGEMKGICKGMGGKENAKGKGTGIKVT